MTPRERTALHEAAHVVVGRAVGIDVTGAMVMPEGGGHVFYARPADDDAEAALALSGRIAVRMVTVCEDDWRDAGWLRAVLALEGTDLERDDEALIRGAEIAVLALYRNWRHLVALAQTLHDDGVVGTHDYEEAAA